MVIVVDDTLLLPIAMIDQDEQLPLISPNLYMITFKALRTHALEEMYPIGKIQAAIKENRMEYELGEITKEEYDEANKILMEKLRIAKKVKEMDLGVRVNILKTK